MIHEGTPVEIVYAVEHPDKSSEGYVDAFSSTSLGVEQLFAALQLGRNSTLYVMDRQGRLVNPLQSAAKGQNLTPLPADPSETGVLRYADVKGAQRLLAYASLPTGGWKVMADGSWQDMMASLRVWELSTTLPVLRLAAALIVLGTIALLAVHIISPLRHLNRIAAQLAWGDWQPTQAHTDDAPYGCPLHFFIHKKGHHLPA